jgi:hypothetical protein
MSDIASQMAAGHLGVLTIVAWAIVAFLLALAGGAVTGVKLAGKDLGNELAAMMGAMFGPTAAVPGIVVGLIVLSLI